MLQGLLKTFALVKARYERQPGREAGMICRAGPHMGCAVMKLQKARWTNDDLSKMGNQTGIFFSIWVGEAGAAKGRAAYNIHAMSVRLLRGYRLTGNEFCDRFREEFERGKRSWPNVTTDFGCCTLMQGWFEITRKSLARDTLALMKRFDKNVAPIIDGLMMQRLKAVKGGRH